MFWKPRTVLIATIVAALVAGLATFVSEARIDRIGWPFLAVVVAAFLSPLVSLVSWRERPKPVVLWCRRFGHPDHRLGMLNRWHWQVLLEACNGLAIPVTLQDESVEASQDLAGNVGGLVHMLAAAGALGLVPMTLVAPVLLFGEGWSEWLALPAVIALTAVPIALGVWTGRRVGSMRADPESTALRIRDGVSRRFPRREMLVLRCEASKWKACVSAAIESADLVVVDVTDPSLAIDWELRQARSGVGDRRTLLLRARELDWADGPISLESGELSLLSYNLTVIAGEIEAWHQRARRRQAAGEALFLDASNPLGPQGTALAAALRAWLQRVQCPAAARPRDGQRARPGGVGARRRRVPAKPAPGSAITASESAPGSGRSAIAAVRCTTVSTPSFGVECSDVALADGEPPEIEQRRDG